jgi:hypothetical protein
MSLERIIAGFILIIIGVALLGIPMYSLVGILMIMIGFILIGIEILKSWRTHKS